MKQLKERLMERTVKTESCWIWTGSKFPRGYGCISFCNKNRSVHKLSYQIFIGPVSNGLEVCHKCNNKACLNPEHLYLASHKENLNHASRDGLIPFGENGSNSKLKQIDVDEIRKIYKKYKKGCGCHFLARKFFVSPSTINRITSGRTWKHAKS